MLSIDKEIKRLENDLYSLQEKEIEVLSDFIETISQFNDFKISFLDDDVVEFNYNENTYTFTFENDIDNGVLCDYDVMEIEYLQSISVDNNTLYYTIDGSNCPLHYTSFVGIFNYIKLIDIINMVFNEYNNIILKK